MSAKGVWDQVITNRLRGGPQKGQEETALEQMAGLPALPVTDSFFFLCFQAQFRGEATRHVTAIRLAIRLYRNDHAGAYPAALTELVPAYLPTLPRDPFFPGGRPLRYSSEPSPRVYSVGPDGFDDGGTSVMPADHGDDIPRSEWDQPDAVFLLDQLQRRL